MPERQRDRHTDRGLQTYMQTTDGQTERQIYRQKLTDIYAGDRQTARQSQTYEVHPKSK